MTTAHSLAICRRTFTHNAVEALQHHCQQQNLQSRLWLTQTQAKSFFNKDVHPMGTGVVMSAEELHLPGKIKFTPVNALVKSRATDLLKRFPPPTLNQSKRNITNSGSIATFSPPTMLMFWNASKEWKEM